jgi:hypothetical protein
MQKGKPKRKLPDKETVERTKVIRIPEYLHAEVLLAASRSGYGGVAPARILLERLDPEVAKAYPNTPAKRR